MDDRNNHNNEIVFPDNRYAICIGRSLGSCGLKVAIELQKRLGIKLYDKNILDKAAEDSNIRKELFENADEQNTFRMPIVYAPTFGMPNSFFVYTDDYLSNEHLFTVQAETIERIASKSNAIFVGRAADYVLRDHPHMVSIFIADHFDVRAERVKQRLELETLEEAKNQVEKIDKSRRDYYNYFTSRRWGEADNYDLCVRISEIGIDYAVSMIVDLIRHRGFPLNE